MPLSGISRRTGPLAAFTYRELIGQRRLAERAIRRGRNTDQAQALHARIEAELERRRDAKFDRAGVAPVRP